MVRKTLEQEKKTNILDTPAAPDTTDPTLEPETLKAKWQRIAGRLQRMNKLVWFGSAACIVFIVLAQFIPDTIGSFHATWMRSTLEAIFTSLLGAAVVMLLFDYYDISNEFNYLKQVIIELLEMHQETDKLDRTVETALVQGMDKGAGSPDIAHLDDAISEAIKTKYGLTDSDEDVQKVDSLMEDMDRKFHDFVAKI